MKDNHTYKMDQNDHNMGNQYTHYIRLMQGANSMVEGNSVDIDLFYYSELELSTNVTV